MPRESKQEKKEHEVVKAPEFGLTTYAKGAAAAIPVLAGAIIAIFEENDVAITEPIWIAILGVIGLSLLAAGLVMAVDVGARAYLAGEGSAKEVEAGKAEGGEDSAQRHELVPAPPGTTVWVDGSDHAHPALAFAIDDGGAVSYLVATGSTVERDGGSRAIDGAPELLPAEKVRATKPAKWP